jgi:hypothetical protein
MDPGDFDEVCPEMARSSSMYRWACRALSTTSGSGQSNQSTRSKAGNGWATRREDQVMPKWKPELPLFLLFGPIYFREEISRWLSIIFHHEVGAHDRRLPNKSSVTGFGFSPGDGGDDFFPPKRKPRRSSHRAVSVGEQNGPTIAAFFFPGYFAPRRHFVGKCFASQSRQTDSPCEADRFD